MSLDITGTKNKTLIALIDKSFYEAKETCSSPAVLGKLHNPGNLLAPNTQF